MAIATTKSNKGWHSRWFYVKNIYAAPLPLFTSCTIAKAPPKLSSGQVDKEKKRLAPLPSAITHLMAHGLHGAIIIGAYHSRRMASLMAHTLPLFGMAAGVQLEGTALAQGILWNSKIQHRIREALEEPNMTFLVEDHLLMRPNTGLVDLVSISLTPTSCLAPFVDSYLRFHGTAHVGSV
jgi:hypothetical protein